MTGSLARRLLALALVLGVATDILFRGNALGANVPIDVALLLVAGALAAGPARIRRVDRLDAWLAPAALVFAAFVALRTDPALVAVDVCGAVILGGAALASLGGRALMRADAGQVVGAAGEMVLATIIGAIPVLGAVRPQPGERTRRAAPAWAGPLLRGTLVAVPLLVIFGALFAAADAVFASAAGRVLELPFALPLGEIAERSVSVAVVAWIAAGVLVVAAGFWVLVTPPAESVRFAEDASDAGSADLGPAGVAPGLVAPGALASGGDLASAGAPAGANAPTWADGGRPGEANAPTEANGGRPGRFRIGTLEAVVVLVLVDALFAAFVVLQVAYLFGGLDTLAAAGLTYADYARRGFFELLAAAALAAGVVATLDARVRRRSRLFVGAALGLLVLTGVTLVSSFLRLRLYQDAYGWTELRFWVLLSIGWLAVALVAVGVLVVLNRSGRLVHVLGVLGVAAVLVANVAGPQGFVAARNLERALDPSLVPPGGQAGLDAEYLSTLGDDAVPAMVDALPGLSGPDRVAVRATLQERRRQLATDPSLAGWPAWNLSRTQARAALDTLAP